MVKLYQEIILDHYRNPRFYGLGSRSTAESMKVNPTCGDEITVQVLIREGKIDDVRFETAGCAISRASASAMSECLVGESIDSALAIVQLFRGMIVDGVDADYELLGDCAAFSGVAQYPGRVGCALLGWRALVECLSP